MRKIILTLTAIFICAATFAHTINWHVDGTLYQTTTCEINNDVLLPTEPIKRGYTFKGWEEEHFFRGEYDTWSKVPLKATAYERDTYNNRIPAHSDYIIVNDASDYIPLIFNDNFEIWNVSHDYRTIWAYRYKDNVVQKSVVYASGGALKPEEDWWTYFGPNNEIIIKRQSNAIYVIAQTTLRLNGKIYTVGETILSTNITDQSTEYNTHVVEFLSDTDTNHRIQGKWKFIYSGVWEEDGKKAWIPDNQIINK